MSFSPAILLFHLLLPLLFVTKIVFCSQDILLESTLVRCIQDEMLEDGTPKNPLQLVHSFKGDPKLNLKLYAKCRKKLQITLRVNEASETFVPNALILIDKVKNAQTQKASHLGVPLAVKFHQEPLLQRYSLKYLYRVNGKMWEEVINAENKSNFTKCIDGSGESNEVPTCGHVPTKGTKQSAGFCCSCKDHRNMVQQRGGQRCDTPGKTPEQLSSAHCLHFSPYWYNVYEISPPTLYQKIIFEVFKSMELKNGSVTWERMSRNKNGIKVDSDAPMNVVGNVKVTYRPHIEGISRSATLFDPSKQRLLFPLQGPFVGTEPDPEPLQGLVESQVLIVPKTLLSPHGAACDRAGTNIDAFLNQTNPCRQERGACLKNQPFDLWKQDEGVHGSSKSKFRLTSYQTGHVAPLLDFVDDYKTGSLYVQQRAEAPTYVDIEIPADDIVVLAPGYNAFIESVLTDTGDEGAKIVAHIFNRELVEATFSVELVQCSMKFAQGNSMGRGVEMKTAPKKIGPLNGLWFHLDIHSFVIKQSVNCYVVLVNEFGENVAAREVTLQPFETCLCVHTCRCACGQPSNVHCEKMSDENIIATGLIATIKTANQLNEEESQHFSKKYRWVFHWILMFHMIVIMFGLIGWIHKRCSRPIAKKRYLAKDSYESVPDDLNSSSGSDSSEITLYKKQRRDTVSKLLEDVFEKDDSKIALKKASQVSKSTESQSAEKSFSENKVKFSDHDDLRPPTEEASSLLVSQVESASTAQAMSPVNTASIQNTTNKSATATPKSVKSASSVQNITSYQSTPGSNTSHKSYDHQDSKNAHGSNKTSTPGSNTSHKSYDHQDSINAPGSNKTLTPGSNTSHKSYDHQDSKNAPGSKKTLTPGSKTSHKSYDHQDSKNASGSNKTSTPGSKTSHKSYDHQDSKNVHGSNKTSIPGSNTSHKLYDHQDSKTAHGSNKTSTPGSNTSHKSYDHQDSKNAHGSNKTSDVLIPEKSKSSHSRGQDSRRSHGPSGPQSVDPTEIWSNNNSEDLTNIDSFVQYCVSASSSKTSFGTFHRKRRDQYSAYDFLPEPKNK